MSQARIWIWSVVLVAMSAVAAMTFAFGGHLRTILGLQVSGLVLHPPSDRDQFFNLVAVNFNRPALCNRIDWRADATSGGWDSPYLIRTMRSKCRGDLKLPPTIIVSEVPLSMQVFAAQVRALGYTDADVTQAAYAENYSSTPIYEIYRGLLGNNEFRSRLRATSGYGELRDRARLRPARSIEFMYRTVAVDAPEAPLCSKISPNATFEDETSRIALLQSRCYLYLALNTRDIRMCDPLPAAGSFPHINDAYDSRERCREVVAIYSRPDYKSNLTYESAPVPRAADFEVILREIGYQADTLPRMPEPTPDDYWEFVSRLRHRGPDNDRAEFLRRVEALK